MAQHVKAVAAGYRIRDLTAGIVVLGIGSAMIHTVVTNGAGYSVFLTRWAFLLGAAALLAAYGTGVVLDRVGGRYPALTRPRQSGVPLLFVLSVTLIAMGYGAFFARGWVIAFLERLVH